MANLSNLIRWQRFEPDLGENRTLPKPFYLEVAVGLTKPELLQLGEAIDAPVLPSREDGAPEPSPEEVEAALVAKADKLAVALAPWVRFGSEPLAINGEPVTTLTQLLRLYIRAASGAVGLLEVPMALRWFNGAGGGTTQLFFERLSGGFVSTTQPSNGKAGSQRAAR